MLHFKLFNVTVIKWENDHQHRNVNVTLNLIYKSAQNKHSFLSMLIYRFVILKASSYAKKTNLKEKNICITFCAPVCSFIP